MQRVFVTVLLLILVVNALSPATAQGGHPLTPENAAQVGLLMRLGYGTVTSVAWSPDGTTLAVAGSVGVWLYDAAHLGSEPRLLEGQLGTLSAITFSPDGKMLASANDLSGDRTVWLWDVATGQKLKELKDPENSPVQALIFSPDGTTLATGEGYPGYKVRLWDVATGENTDVMNPHTDSVTSLAYTPDGSRLVSASSDGTIQGWNDEVAQELMALQQPEQPFPIESIALKPDEDVLAFAGLDSKIWVWDAAQRKAAALEGHTGWINSIAFSPDGTLLASGSSDSTVLLWQMADVQAAMLEEDPQNVTQATALKGHTEAVTSVVFSPDGQKLAAGSDDGTVRIWDVASGRTLAVLGGPTGWVDGLAYSPDGDTLASGYANIGGYGSGAIQLWDTVTGKKLSTLPMPGYNMDVSDVAYSPDGTILAAGSSDRTIWLWDTVIWSNLPVLDAYVDETVYSAPTTLAYSPDSLLLAVGYGDHAVRLWNTVTGEIVQVLECHSDILSDVAFSPDGTILATASPLDNAVCLWDVDAGEKWADLNIPAVQALAYSPDGTTLATAGLDVQLWHLAAGETPEQDPNVSLQDTAGFTSIAYSPDGRLLATGNKNGIVRLWDAATGQNLAAFHSGTVRILEVTFSPDGTQIAVGSEDGMVRVWGIPQGTALPTVMLTPFPPAPSPVIQELFFPYGCTACHSFNPNETLDGPSLAGIGTRAATRIEGMSAEEYIRQSITDPSAYTVAGFPDDMPPYTIVPDILAKMIEYLLSLK